MAQLPALTGRQELFATEYVRHRDPGLAYRVAYDAPDGVSRGLANQQGRQVLQSPAVTARVQELIDLAIQPALTTTSEIAALFWSIVKADPNDLISLKVGACRYCHGAGHGYHWRLREYLEALQRAELAAEVAKPKDKDAVSFPDPGGGFDYDATRPPHPECPECHGEGVARIVARDTEDLPPGARLLYGGVKHTNSGPQIIMADRMKALENLAKIVGAIPPDKTTPGVVNNTMNVLNLAGVDPVEASRMYREFVSSSLAVDATVKAD